MPPEAPRRRIREMPPGPRVDLGYRGFKTDMREFESMDLLQQLRYSFRIAVDTSYDVHERRVIRTKAIRRALETDPRERDTMEIRIIAHGDLDARRRVRTEFPDWSMYSVYVGFPTEREGRRERDNGDESENVRRMSLFVSTNNHSLRDELPHEANVDQLVNYQADAVRDETLYEKHTRLILEIKAIDADIHRRIEGYPQPRSQTTSELNHWKLRRIMEYLQTSFELQEEYPEIAMDYFSINTDESGKARLSLKSLTDKYFYKRLGTPSADSELRASGHEASTGLQLTTLLRDYGKFIKDPGGISDDAEISVGICRMLGLSTRPNAQITDAVAEGPVLADGDEPVAGEVLHREAEVKEPVVGAVPIAEAVTEDMAREEDASGATAEDLEDSGTVVYTANDQPTAKQVLSNRKRKAMKKGKTKMKHWESTFSAPAQPVVTNAPRAAVTTPEATRIRRKAEASQFETVSYAELAARFGLTLPVKAGEIGSFTDTVAEFLDVFVTSKGLEVPFIRQLQFVKYLANINPEMAKSKTSGIVDAILDLSTEQRQKLGIYPIAVGDITTDDPIYQAFPQIHQYQINLIYSENGAIRMASTTRGELVGRTRRNLLETLAITDRRVTETVEITPESLADRYIRLLAEVRQIDTILEEQKRQARRYSYKVMGDVPGREENERAIRERIAGLTESKKALLLRTLTAAEQVQKTYALSPLVSIREGESEASVFLSFQEIEEKNRTLRLLGLSQEPKIISTEILPETFVMLKKDKRKNATRVYGTTEATIDEQLAQFIQERKQTPSLAPFDEDIPEALQSFADLTLHDQLVQASIDTQAGQNGTFDRLTALAEKRIVMRNVLGTTQDIRDELGVTVMVSGPKKNGRVVITDNFDLTQYSVHIIFPAGKFRKAYLADVRYALAGNPYMRFEPGAIKYIPTRADLVALDSVVNALKPTIRPDEDDPYMKFFHTVAAIQFVDAKIKALRDQDMTDDERKKRTTNLFMTKMPFILSFIEIANMLYQEHPEYGQLYEVEPSKFKGQNTFVMHLLSDLNTKAFVTENTGPQDRNIIQTGSPTRTPLYVQTMRVAKETYEAGFDESDLNGVAAAIYDLLELDRFAG